MNLYDPINTILNEAPDESQALAAFMAMILHEDEPHNIQLDIVKEAIATAQYKINFEHIANKLLEFSSDAEVLNRDECFA